MVPTRLTRNFWYFLHLIIFVWELCLHNILFSRFLDNYLDKCILLFLLFSQLYLWLIYVAVLQLFAIVPETFSLFFRFIVFHKCSDELFSLSFQRTCFLCKYRAHTLYLMMHVRKLITIRDNKRLFRHFTFERMEDRYRNCDRWKIVK